MCSALGLRAARLNGKADFRQNVIGQTTPKDAIHISHGSHPVLLKRPLVLAEVAADTVGQVDQEIVGIRSVVARDHSPHRDLLAHILLAVDRQRGRLELSRGFAELQRKGVAAREREQDKQGQNQRKDPPEARPRALASQEAKNISIYFRGRMRRNLPTALRRPEICLSASDEKDRKVLR